MNKGGEIEQRPLQCKSFEKNMEMGKDNRMNIQCQVQVAGKYSF